MIMSTNSEDNNMSNQMMEEDDDSKIFPQRLMEILSDEQYNESISWLPHGRAFVIKNRKLFGETVMPRYFSRKAKYSSFTRKLNRWNFVRVSGGPELGAYYHEFFLRDKPQLAAQMFCKNARSKLAMAAVSECEPKPAPVVIPEPVVAQAQQITPTSAFMDSLRQKVPEQLNNNSNNNSQFKSFPSYGNSTLQLLQRQLEMMQQEQNNKHLELLQQERTNRMLMERSAMQNVLLPPGQQQQSQQPNGQASRLLQMQQLMQMQMQQRQGRIPTNPRASAA